MFSLQKIRREWNRFCLETEGGEVTQTAYTHVSKYKSYEVKGEKNRTKMRNVLCVFNNFLLSKGRWLWRGEVF
jgi:hypothetical protein